MHVAWRSALWQTFKSLTNNWHARCSRRSRGKICLLCVIPPRSSCQPPYSLSALLLMLCFGYIQCWFTSTITACSVLLVNLFSVRRPPALLWIVVESLWTFGRSMVSRIFFWGISAPSDVTKSFFIEELRVFRILKDNFGQMLLSLKSIWWWLAIKRKLNIFNYY